MYTGVHGLIRAGHGLDLSTPRCLLCPAPICTAQTAPPFPAGQLCSSVSRQRQIVDLEPDGLCLVKNHSEQHKWKVSRHPLFLAWGSFSPAVNGAQEPLAEH